MTHLKCLSLSISFQLFFTVDPYVHTSTAVYYQDLITALETFVNKLTSTNYFNVSGSCFDVKHVKNCLPLNINKMAMQIEAVKHTVVNFICVHSLFKEKLFPSSLVSVKKRKPDFRNKNYKMFLCLFCSIKSKELDLSYSLP